MPDKDSPAGHEYLVIGVVLLIIGSWLIHCYYEKSGRSRPFIAKALPGP